MADPLDRAAHGKVDSTAATCIATAASRPGSEELEVGHAAERAAAAVDEPAEPDPHRREEEHRVEEAEKIVPRQMRR